MPNHVHHIFRAKDNNPSVLLKELKTYTSKQLQKAITEHTQECRKEWMPRPRSVRSSCERLVSIGFAT